MVWDSPRSSLTICSHVQDPQYSRLRLHAGLTFVNSVSSVVNLGGEAWASACIAPLTVLVSSSLLG